MKRSLNLAIALVALVGVAAFIGCNADSPTAPETDVAYQSGTVPGGESAVVPGGFTAANQGQADPPPQQCEGMTGKDKGHCVAWAGQNCDATPDKQSCQEIIKHYADTPPWLVEFWPDADGDGFGDAAADSRLGSTVPAGYAEDNTDCNDNDAEIFPGNVEACDGKDNDCDGAIDEGNVCGPPRVPLTCDDIVLDDEFPPFYGAYICCSGCPGVKSIQGWFSFASISRLEENCRTNIANSDYALRLCQVSGGCSGLGGIYLAEFPVAYDEYARLPCP